MFTKDGKVIVSKLNLIPKKGKFLLADRYSNKIMYEVTPELFKEVLVIAANNDYICKTKGIIPVNSVNKIDFLLEQLEFTDELFQATMIEYNKWIYEEEE